MSDYLGVALTVVLLLLNALFVGAEFALISALRTKLEPMVAEGSRAARLALRAMSNVSLVMAAAQLGITLCTLGLGAISEPALAHLMEPAFDALSVPDFLVHPIAFVIATVIVVWAHVVLGEMVPKNLALVGPERAALVLGPFMLAVVWVLKPVVVGLNLVANGACRLFGVEPRDEVSSSYTHDEVAGLVDESRREGFLDEDEYGLVTGALEFEAGTVERVMIARERLTTVPPGATPADVERACAETGFSRFPVADGDDLVGYLHIKDVLEPDEERRQRPLTSKRFRSMASVSPGSPLHDALRSMQSRGAHLARVVGADGRVAGVVMLEDVLEELVGEIDDAGRVDVSRGRGARPASPRA